MFLMLIEIRLKYPAVCQGLLSKIVHEKMVTDRFIYIVYGSMNVYKKKSEVAAALSDY